MVEDLLFGLLGFESAHIDAFDGTFVGVDLVEQGLLEVLFIPSGQDLGLENLAKRGKILAGIDLFFDLGEDDFADDLTA